jgi:hypothetical protein
MVETRMNSVPAGDKTPIDMMDNKLNMDSQPS